VPGGGGGGNIGGRESISAGGGAIPEPSFNVVGNTGINQLAGAVNNQLGTPTRAYVVQGDISTAQQLERDSIRESSLG